MTKQTLSAINAYGTKSITFDQYPPESWEWMTGDPDGNIDSIKEMWATVPWLYAGVNIISQSAAEIPIALYRGETEVTSNEDWKDPTGYIPDLNKLIRKLSASITLEGQGYLFRDQAKTIRATKKLIFWNPTTVKVNWRLTVEKGELWFDRSVNGKVEQYSAEQVIYFWPDDGYTEVGPPASSPAKAALAAAGVLYNADKYVAAYWSRGAVKAMMLAVEGNPSEAEKLKLTTWWKSITGGVRKAFSVFTMNAKAVTPVVVGDGLAGLQDTALTTEKREDISTALGVPQSILFSTNAGGLGGAGVVSGDRVNLYELTVIPLCKLICSALNEQQLSTTGYRLVVNENEMPMYQADEQKRAASMDSLVKALADPELFLLSADIIGYEIDDEIRARIEALAAKKEAEPEPIPPALPAPMQPEQMEQEEPEEPEPAKAVDFTADINRWRRKALKAGGACEFVSTTIPADVSAQISTRLQDAKTADEIKAAFNLDEAEPEPIQGYDDTALKSLAYAITQATRAIGQPDYTTPAPVYNMTMPNITVNMPEQTAGSITVNVPDQPAPVVNVTNEVQPAAPAVNNITIQPAKVQLPALPVEATITMDANGKKTLKVTK